MVVQRATGLGLVLLAWTGCGEPTALESLEQDAVFGVPNVDDDDGNRRRDFRDADPEDEDLAVLSLEGVADGMRRRHRLRLRLGGQTDQLRVYGAGGDGRSAERLLEEGSAQRVLDREEVPSALLVEFRDFLSEGTLDLEILDPRDEVLETRTLRLLGAPLILNHHLQPVETTYIVEGIGSYAAFDNLDMLDDMAAVLRGSLRYEPIVNYEFDPWVQDEFETATLTAPGVDEKRPQRFDVVIDSIRDRGLDDFPENVVVPSRNGVVRTWGRAGGYPSSQESFGNLEVSPPVTVDGVTYPFGRIYWGSWEDNGGVDPQLGDLLRAQRVQEPFVMDVSWLCVAHVDEFVTFIPDPDAPKGYRMLVTDTGLGFELLEAQDPDTSLPRYGRDHGYPTIGSMLNDVALRALNEDLQRDWIEPAIDQLRAELGVEDEDIVRIPGLFEEAYSCGPYVASLIPGTVNLLSVTDPDGSATLFLPDPVLRSAPDALDPLIADVNDRLPASATPVWVDNWNMYHVALGEVHCGTNVTRTPTDRWWESALHLIDGEDR